MEATLLQFMAMLGAAITVALIVAVFVAIVAGTLALVASAHTFR